MGGGGGGAYPRVVKTVNGEGGLSDGGAYLRRGLIGRILRYLIYDYPHIFKNLRNNWITEAQKQLIFMVDGKEYLACWNDCSESL